MLELFTVANVATDYLVNHSSKEISDVTIAFLALENVDFYVLYAIYLRHFGETLLGHSGHLKFYGCKNFLPKGGRVLGDLEHQSTCKKLPYDTICSRFNSTAPDYLY